MDVVSDMFAEKKDKIEKALVFAGQGSKVLATTVGKLNTILEVAFELVAILLKDQKNNVQSQLTQDFEKVYEKLVGIIDETGQISRMLAKSSLNEQYFSQETQILSQFEKFQDFVMADPEYRDIKKTNFIHQYKRTDRDKNLDDLYDSITGKSFSGRPMLEIILDINERDRRATEIFCAHLKKLFVVGIINVMFYTSLTSGNDVEDIKKKWLNQLEDVEKRMKAAVDDCTENFAKQAKLDVEAYFQKNPGTTEVALLELLVKKFDWVRWSIYIIEEKERTLLYDCLVGKDYHGIEGNHWFNLLKENINVVVSFSVSPKPIDKVQIQEHLEQKKLRGNMKAVALALALHKDFPDFVVHAVNHYKTMKPANNFPEDCYYYEKYKRAYLVIHSE